MVFQMFGVEVFGEVEFWFVLIKLFGLIVYFIFFIIYVVGGFIGQDGVFGFCYWNDLGFFNNNGFCGVVIVFVFCLIFYVGVEVIVIVVGEICNFGVVVFQVI